MSDFSMIFLQFYDTFDPTGIVGIFTASNAVPAHMARKAVGQERSKESKVNRDTKTAL